MENYINNFTALLVIDMQRYFVQPQYPFGKFIKQFVPQGSKAYFNRVEQIVIPNIKRHANLEIATSTQLLSQTLVPL